MKKHLFLTFFLSSFVAANALAADLPQDPEYLPPPQYTPSVPVPPVADGLNLREGPGTEYPIIFRIPTGSPDIQVTGPCVAGAGAYPFPWCVVGWGDYSGWTMISPPAWGAPLTGVMHCDVYRCYGW